MEVPGGKKKKDAVPPEVHEEYVKQVTEPPGPVVSVDQQSAIRVLTKVTPPHEREYEVQCPCCNSRVAFRIHHVHKSCSSWASYFFNEPDTYNIKCPICNSLVSVKGCLPAWVIKLV